MKNNRLYPHTRHFVSHVAIFGSNSDVFSLCLKEKETGEMPGAIVLVIPRQAQS